jgi:hypothetical protein
VINRHTFEHRIFQKAKKIKDFNMNNKKTTWIVRIAAFATGILACTIFSGQIKTGLTLQSLGWIYEKVGITIIALIPLAIWSVWTVIRSRGEHDMTLAYIGTTSQRVGLLGTVIGIVAATVKIGDGLSGGAAGAVTSALPAVGQALVSTAVGFVIAIICDFFRYLNANASQNDDVRILN